MKRIPALKTAVMAGAALLGLSGCAATGDIVISEDSENRGELIADYSHTFTISAEDIDPDARVLPDGFDFDCAVLEDRFGFDAEYSIDKQQNPQRQSCVFNFNQLSLPDISSVLSNVDGTDYSIDIFHVEEDGLVVVEANDALSDSAQDVTEGIEEDIEGYEAEDVESNMSNGEDDEMVSDALSNQSSELIFEFPGDIVSATDGALIDQRDYDGSVDRSRIVNQDVGSASIIHLEGEEVLSDFQIVAEDGLSYLWWQWALWIGGGLVGAVVITLVVLIVISRRRDSVTSFSKHKNRDPNAATLDNPDGDLDIEADKKKKSKLPTQTKQN